MGNKSAPAAPAVRPPSPAEIAASQVSAARGILDLQLEKFPEFTRVEGDRIRALAPITAESIADAQDVFIENVRDQFPQFFEALEGLGGEAINRLNNIGVLPQDVVDQSIEQSLSAFANRGIAESPLAIAGTAGQLSALGQNQRAQDISLAQAFLNSPFAPNVPLPGLPAQSFVGTTPQAVLGASGAAGLGTQAQSLALQGAFSNAALQQSNALLAGGSQGNSGTGQAIGGLVGAGIGTFVAPGIGTAAGAGIGSQIGGLF